MSKLHIERSWRNVFIGMFVLPVRVPLLMLLYFAARLANELANGADVLFRLVHDKVPGLARDEASLAAERQEQLSELIDRLTQRNRRG